MACAIMYFKHDLLCGQSSDLSVNTPGAPNPGGIRVGLESTVTIRLWNQTEFQAYGSIVLYWAQVFPNGACYQFQVYTAVPIAAHCVPKQVPGLGSQSFQVPWVPGPNVVGSAACPNDIALFAQAVVTADPAHGCPFGSAHPADFDFTSVYNAATVFPLV